MQQVQNEAYSLTDELRRIQKDEKTSAAQRAVRAREIARKDTESLLKQTDAKPKPVKEFVPLKEVQIGQEVIIADLGQTATVTARPDRNGMVEVRARHHENKGSAVQPACPRQDGKAQAGRAAALHPRAVG